MKSALVLLAHGSREAGWAEPFLAIRNKVAAACPDLTVEVAFLEMMTPLLEECISGLAARGHQHVTVAPLFLGMGAHLKRDLPRRLDGIQNDRRSLEIVVAPSIGEADELLEAIAGWLSSSAPR